MSDNQKNVRPSSRTRFERYTFLYDGKHPEILFRRKQNFVFTHDRPVYTYKVQMHIGAKSFFRFIFVFFYSLDISSRVYRAIDHSSYSSEILKGSQCDERPTGGGGMLSSFVGFQCDLHIIIPRHLISFFFVVGSTKISFTGESLVLAEDCTLNVDVCFQILYF